MTIQDILGLRPPTVFKPKTTVHPVECAAPEQIVGVEIETENCTRNDDYYQSVLSKLWQVKTDGSLRGLAYEFITKPVEIRFLIPELADFFLKTGFNELNYTDRCSIHVHTNITDMTATQVATLTLLYSIFEETLFEFVNHYHVDDKGGKYRDTNIYCVPWNQCRMNHNMVQTMYTDVDFTFRHWQKYTALNVLPARTIGTLEWRHMHGTADMDKITKWLNLIGSIINYSKKNEFETVVKTVKELNDTSAYRQFYTNVLGDYLPYTDRYARAIADGVVNAKYALIGLRDNKPVNKATRVNPHREAGVAGGIEAAPLQFWGDEVQLAEPGLVAARTRPVDDMPRQLRIADMALNAAPAGQHPLGARVAPNRRRPITRLQYPIKRIQYYLNENDRHGAMWAVEDSLGQRVDRAGARLPLGALVVEDVGLETYCQNLEAGFWNTVAADWRPRGGGDWLEIVVRPEVAARLQGGF